MPTQTSPPTTVPGAATEPADYEAMFQRYHARLVRYAAGKFGSSQADEIAQEAMLRLWTHGHTLRAGMDPWPWLKTVARNIGVDKWRARDPGTGVELEVVDMDPLLATPSAEHEVISRARNHQVRSALSRLDPTYRRVIVLRDLDGMTSAEVGSLLGLSPNAVRQHLFRARRRLAMEYVRLVGRAGVLVLQAARAVAAQLARHRRALVVQAGSSLVLVVAAALVVIGAPSWSRQPGQSRVRTAPAIRADTEGLMLRAEAQPGRTANGAHSWVPAPRPRRRVTTTGAAAPQSPVGVRHHFEHSPLAPDEAHDAQVWVDTPAGRVRVRTHGHNEGVPGPVCSAGVMHCG